jgi:hypothetical protein
MADLRAAAMQAADAYLSAVARRMKAQAAT